MKIFTADTMKLHDKIKEYAGYDTAVYAYPFGKYSALAKDTLKSSDIKSL